MKSGSRLHFSNCLELCLPQYVFLFLLSTTALYFYNFLGYWLFALAAQYLEHLITNNNLIEIHLVLFDNCSISRWCIQGISAQALPLFSQIYVPTYCTHANCHLKHYRDWENLILIPRNPYSKISQQKLSMLCRNNRYHEKTSST